MDMTPTEVATCICDIYEKLGRLECRLENTRGDLGTAIERSRRHAEELLSQQTDVENKIDIALTTAVHANVIAFDNRPFKSLLEMDEALVDRWNAVVSPGDIVYVLGDMFWCKAQDAIPILRSLKGQKFLIKGNHDRCNDNKFLREFVKVTEYLEVKDSGRTVILCHYPIPCFKNHFYGSFHLYGHVHNSFEWNMMEHDKYLMEELYTTPCQMFNVGAMMPWMDYTPRTLDEIIAANSHNEAVRNK